MGLGFRVGVFPWDNRPKARKGELEAIVELSL